MEGGYHQGEHLEGMEEDLRSKYIRSMLRFVLCYSPPGKPPGGGGPIPRAAMGPLGGKGGGPIGGNPGPGGKGGAMILLSIGIRKSRTTHHRNQAEA